MHRVDYSSLFECTTGHAPYPYQRRIAEASEFPDLIEIPTGLGKTEAIALAWLWRRRLHPSETVRKRTARRLVWCLPMRSLVEQTKERLEAAFLRLRNDGVVEPSPAVYLLMGGESPTDWADHPEQDAILIGTQDMLLSRALNRGYGASRYRWPREFGLLHSDALWVFDEIQLMGVGLATSTQLEAFRRCLGSYGSTRSLWMSATVQREWLGTVDMRSSLAGLSVLGLGEEDQCHPAVRQRIEASKALDRLDLAVPVKKSDLRGWAKGLAAWIVAEHRDGTLTLSIHNTVGRAQAVYAALIAMRPVAETLLLHSRFRGPDRAAAMGHLMEPSRGAGRIAVCTQVVEAGIDLSSSLLVTELAPWPSLVQRFGRCNRAGTDEAARILWVDVPESVAAPYEADSLTAARNRLGSVPDGNASPRNLPGVTDAFEPSAVLRRHELLELFDTDPDLCGADLDVSTFIRDGDELDVLIFWRRMVDGRPSDDIRPRPDELCSVPIQEARNFLEAHAEESFVFDVLDETWRPLRRREGLRGLVPGRIILLDSRAGGYDPGRGWIGKDGRHAVPEIEGTPADGEEWSSGDDPRSFAGGFVSLTDHVDAVVREGRALLAGLAELGVDSRVQKDVIEACRWHDAGKAHVLFQEFLLAGLDGEEFARRSSVLWAKSSSRAGRHRKRPGFRHELASGIAALQSGVADLAAYLAAAHHGKIRMAIRSLPGERPCPECAAEARIARGIHEHDELPLADLGGGVTLPRARLDLSPMDMGLDEQGRPSWQDRALRLLEELGPFRLAFLEALVRVADARGSAVVASAALEATHA
ncbi:MAG: DEAD/DEAH box helicase [Candidatus Thermoplasmatota archaeon]